MGKKAGKIALGLGLLTGALAGLLFAPDEGKNIRKKIAKGDTEGLINDLEHMGQEMKDMVMDFVSTPSIQDLLDKAKDKAADVADMKREELDGLLTRANNKADEFKKTAASYVREQKAILEKHLSKKAKKPAKKAKGTAKKTRKVVKKTTKAKSTKKA